MLIEIFPVHHVLLVLQLHHIDYNYTMKIHVVPMVQDIPNKNLHDRIDFCISKFEKNCKIRNQKIFKKNPIPYDYIHHLFRS